MAKAKLGAKKGGVAVGVGLTLCDARPRSLAPHLIRRRGVCGRGVAPVPPAEWSSAADQDGEGRV